MSTASKLSLTVVALLALGATAAQAQGVSNTIVATANVLTPLTVTGTTTLDFGNVFPGVAKTVATTDGTAGKFTVGGQASAQVSITFTVPANLPGTAGAAIGNNLPIGTWTGGYDTDDTQASTAGLDMTGGATLANLDGTTGALFAWVGATVSPSAGQPAGTYATTVTMTVAYTGL